ncbi:aldehyde dehydrogenase family protein [Brevibacterium sp. 'Marine']|uniref:aldehyde dehydrogenase family protein n=1 Tax=Brevibacterium sp. 'Marine' TaxID=2725563 RepID=UPI00145DF98B|nr:aldehyde dehydrogenase family protein [Brevibacterium sp. 'Marine']
MMNIGTLKNLVNGQFAASSSGEEIAVYNPATRADVVGKVPAMSPEDVADVYAAAREGAKTWKRTDRLARAKVLLDAAGLIRSNQEELATLIVAEMGKTRSEAFGEVGKTAEFFEYYGGMGRDGFGEFLPDARQSTFAARLYEPIGVVLLITPWNDPLLTPARKMAPALIAGNSVVIKPATLTPLITLRLAQLLDQAGLPSGVLGTVTGRIGEMGDALFDSPDLRAVSFTGSTSVGKRLQADLAGSGIRVQTEMGGKNASVIMDDADLSLAVPAIVSGAFAQAGQRCTATSRLIVHSAIADEAREKIAEAILKLKVAPGDSDAVDMGPVVDHQAQRDIDESISHAISQGAEVLASGRLGTADANEGAFVSPTFLRISTTHDIWRDEIFGPVLSMTEVDDLDEAIAAVNDSTFGLSSAIFTRSLDSAFRFVEEVDTGQVSVNQPTSGWDIHHPFGGFKESGSAFKEQGRDALNFYTRIKTAAVRTH